MEEKGGFLPEKTRPAAWKVAAAVTLVVAAAVAVTVPTLLCHRGGDGNSTERLEKALDVTNRSLALGRWQRCREELGELQGKVSELEQALANVTRLEEQNRALGTEVTRLREQLGEEQNLRSQLQLQNRLIRDQLQDMRRAQRSTGDKPALSPDVPKLLLLLLLAVLAM